MRMTVGRKLGIGFGLIVIILIVIGAISFRSIRIIMQNVILVEHANEVLRKANLLEVSLANAQRGERGYVITGDDDFLKVYHDSQKGHDIILSDIKELVMVAEQKSRVEQMVSLVDTEFAALQEVIDLRKDKGIEAATEAVKSDKGKKAHDEFMRVMNELLTAERKLLAERVEAQKAAESAANAMIMFGTILAIVLSSLLGFFITRTITRPLSKLIGIANVAADGDLTKEVSVDTNDEVGDLAKAFGKMLTGLKDIVGKVLDTAERVSASSQELSSSAQEMNATTEEVSSTVQQISKGTETQAQRVEETQKAMEQMSAAVEQVSKSAQNAANQAQDAAKTAQAGGEAAKEAQGRMLQVSEVVVTSASAVRKLSERSEQVSEIVKVITHIADQTNLLALNAAIEAARAGEYGRGFAVVAEEVRKLAEASAKSADEIEKLIKDVQKETGQAVTSIEGATKEVATVKDIAQKLQEGLINIVKNAETVATMAEQVSAASEQQASGVTQVSKSVSDIASVAEQSASATQEASASTEEMTASMEQMAASAQELADMGIQMRDLVGKFKIGEDISRQSSVVSRQEKEGSLRTAKLKDQAGAMKKRMEELRKA